MKVLSCLVSFCLVQSCREVGLLVVAFLCLVIVFSCRILVLWYSYLALCCAALHCRVLSCAVLRCVVWPCVVLCCLILTYLILSCLVLSVGTFHLVLAVDLTLPWTPSVATPLVAAPTRISREKNASQKEKSV